MRRARCSVIAGFVATMASLTLIAGCAGRSGAAAPPAPAPAAPPAPAAAARPGHPQPPRVGADVPPAVAQALLEWKTRGLEPFLVPGQPEADRILDYSIDAITLQARQDGGNVYMVEYSVLPAEPYRPAGPITTRWRAGSGQLEPDGWVRGKVDLVKVVPDGKGFRFESGLP